LAIAEVALGRAEGFESNRPRHRVEKRFRRKDDIDHDGRTSLVRINHRRTPSAIEKPDPSVKNKRATTTTSTMEWTASAAIEALAVKRAAHNFVTATTTFAISSTQTIFSEGDALSLPHSSVHLKDGDEGV
jgi:hypothetical protein